jgi:hypothetical protein
VKKLLGVLACAVVVAAAVVSPAPAATTCNSTITDTTISGNVIVPNGANCRLIRVHVTGNIQVQGGGALILQGTTVDGSVQSTGARWVRIDNRSRIRGSVQILGTTGTPPGFTWNMICISTIGGNLQISNNFARFAIGDPVVCSGGNAIGGSVQVSGNQARVRVSNNAIGNSLQCSGNTPPATGNPGSNSVGGVKQGEGCASA